MEIRSYPQYGDLCLRASTVTMECEGLIHGISLDRYLFLCIFTDSSIAECLASHYQFFAMNVIGIVNSKKASFKRSSDRKYHVSSPRRLT